MNYAIVRYVIGYVLYFEAAFMVPPCMTAIIYQESCGWSFVITGLLCVLLGFILTHKKPKNKVFYTKEGFVTVALSWIILSIMGSLPSSSAARSPIPSTLYSRQCPVLPPQEPAL